MHLPLTVLSTLDAVLRDTAVFSMLTDWPGLVVVRHDVISLPNNASVIRRLIVDAGGVLEDTLVPLEHACVSCAVREDALPTLRRLADLDRWSSSILALPVGGDLLPSCFVLSEQMAPGDAGRLPALQQRVPG